MPWTPKMAAPQRAHAPLLALERAADGGIALLVARPGCLPIDSASCRARGEARRSACLGRACVAGEVLSRPAWNSAGAAPSLERRLSAGLIVPRD